MSSMRLKAENQRLESIKSYSSPLASDSRREHGVQESSYLNEAREAKRALSGSQHVDQGRDGRQQFSLGQILRGEGRAVYSIRDKGALISELNQAFDLGKNRSFSSELLTSLKSFQAEMVKNNPRWNQLEQELNRKGKTLVDGLIGPLTIRALVSEGLLVTQSDGKLRAGARKITKIENLEKAENKEPPPKKEEPPKEFKPRIEQQVKPKEEKPEVEKPSEKVISPNPEVAKLQERLKKSLDTLAQIKLEAADIRSKTGTELEALTKCQKEIRQPSQDGSPIKYLTLSSEFDGIDKKLGVAIRDLSLLKLALKTDSHVENQLSSEFSKLEKLLVDQSQHSDSRQQRQLCKTIGNKIESLNKELKNYSAELMSFSKDLDSTLSDQTANLAEIKNLPAKEATIRAKLAAGDLSVAEPYVKQVMPTDFDKNSSSYWRKVSMENFSKTFNHSPEKSLDLYLDAIQPTWNTEGNRRPIGFGMLFSGNYDAFVSNLESESKNKSNSLSGPQRLQMENYVSALHSCKTLGIENPFRFNATNLIEIVQERQNPQVDKPLLVLTAAKSDHNGAFYNLDNIAKRFIQQGYRIQYHECSIDTDIVKSLELATRSGGKARAVCISGHGNQTSISLSNPDPRFHEINDLDRSIDLLDKNKLAAAANYIEDQAAIIVNSCSTGQGGKLNSGYINNIADLLRAIVPQAAEGFILAPIGPANITEIDFSDRRVKDVETKNRQDEVVPNYQARNSEKVGKDRLEVA